MMNNLPKKIKENQSNIRMPFGPHKGKTLDQCPLKYLDNLVDQDWLFNDMRIAIKAYLNQPEIARLLAEEIVDE